MKAPPEFLIDDAALAEFAVANDLRSVREPERRIMAALRQCGYGSDTVFAIKLAYEEAVTNAVKHGNCNDRSKHVYVRYHVDPRRVVIMVRDEGCGFLPEKVPDPTADENLERPCGRGIMLMSAYMTKLRFSPSGNEVWMLKENPAADNPSMSKVRRKRRA
jgi:serine/threonine-protein kinase RsbW